MRPGLVVDRLNMFRVCLVLFCLGSSALQAEEALKDPTKPYKVISSKPVVMKPSVPLKVTYIKHSVGGNVAYINGELAREGDIVEGMRVAKITDSGVRLTKGGKAVWVALHAGSGITKK